MPLTTTSISSYGSNVYATVKWGNVETNLVASKLLHGKLILIWSISSINQGLSLIEITQKLCRVASDMKQNMSIFTVYSIVCNIETSKWTSDWLPGNRFKSTGNVVCDESPTEFAVWSIRISNWHDKTDCEIKWTFLKSYYRIISSWYQSH